MKKLTLWSIFIFLVLAISIAQVNAQLAVQVPGSASNPTHGGSSQAASNPEDDDTAKHDIFVSKQISVINSDTSPITIGSLTVNPSAGFTTGDLQVTIVGAPVTLPVGTSTINIKARIPKQLDAVDDDFDEVAFLVGNVDLLEDQTNAVKGNIELWMQRSNELSINDMDAIINGKGRQSIDEGDDLKNIKPGDRIEIEVEAENNFDDRTNLDIENVDLEIECDKEENFDFDDKTEEIGDISTEDKETETLTLDVEDDAKDETSNCIVSVDGTDENGARHGEQRNFDIEVERKNHDLLIKGLSANPTSLSCDDTTINMRVDYINLGRSDEDRVAIEATSKLLSYLERIAGLDLDEDDTDEKTFLIPVNPREIKQGPFVIQVQTFYDNTKLSDTATLTMDNLCSEGTPPQTGTGTPTPSPTTRNALVVGSETVTLGTNNLASIPVKVINRENEAIEYTVSLTNTEDFAEPSSAKKVFLNAGQESTVFLNLKAKSNVPAGIYSGTIVLADATGNTLETKTFTVETTGTTGSGSGVNLDFFGEDSSSRIFWIIGDIILIIVAIFFIKLIFTGGRKKGPKAKRMADYEADAGKRR